MSDIALVWDLVASAADFELSAEDPNDLAQDGGLETSILWSIFSDRRAEPGDVLPDGELDRRGWWADAHPVVAGDLFGSRLWLLSRSKETPDVLASAEEYVREALQWLISDRVCDQFDVVVTHLRRGQFGIDVTVHRPLLDSVNFKFNRTWSAQEAQRP